MYLFHIKGDLSSPIFTHFWVILGHFSSILTHFYPKIHHFCSICPKTGEMHQICPNSGSFLYVSIVSMLIYYLLRVILYRSLRSSGAGTVFSKCFYVSIYIRVSTISINRYTLPPNSLSQRAHRNTSRQLQKFPVLAGPS